MEEDQQTPIVPSHSNLRIQQQFFQLQRHWNHYKTSSSDRHSPTMLPNDSPPQDDLISSLHRHGNSTFSASSTWKIRTNELAHDDIRRERRAAITSGQLMARRLSYDDVDMGLGLNADFLHGNHWNASLTDRIFVPSIHSSDSGEDYCNGDLGKDKEEQVPVCLNGLSYSPASSSSSSSLLCKETKKEQMAAKVEENVTPTANEKIENGDRWKIGKWAVGLAWLAIASVVMVIFSVRCLGWRSYDEEQLPFLLVPT